MPPSDPYGVDVALGDDGDLIVTATGGLLDLTGAANVGQALRNRFRVRRGELDLHPDYGTTIDVGGRVDPQLLAAKARQEAADTVRADGRFLAVADVTTTTVARPSIESPRLQVGPGVVGLAFSPGDLVDAAPGTVIVVVTDSGLVSELWVAPGGTVLSGTGPSPALAPGQAYWRTDAAAPGPLEPVIEVDVEPGGTLLTGTVAPASVPAGDLYFQLDGGGNVVAVWADPAMRTRVRPELADHHPTTVALAVRMRLSGGEALTLSGLPDVRLTDVDVDLTDADEPSQLYGDLLDLPVTDQDLIDPTRDDLGESVTLEQLTGEA